jgi:hypothetical protein
MNTHDMMTYIRARLADNSDVVNAPANDPVLLQAQRDGYADRVGGLWIFRGHIQRGEKRIIRYIYGGEETIIGD